MSAVITMTASITTPNSSRSFKITTLDTLDNLCLWRAEEKRSLMVSNALQQKRQLFVRKVLTMLFFSNIETKKSKFHVCLITFYAFLWIDHQFSVYFLDITPLLHAHECQLF